LGRKAFLVSNFRKRWFFKRAIRKENKQPALHGDRISEDILREAEIELKYKGYLERQKKQAEQFKKLEDNRIPEDFDYMKIHGMKTEARQKLTRIRPASLGQASRIQGVTASDISVLMIFLKKH